MWTMQQGAKQLVQTEKVLDFLIPHIFKGSYLVFKELARQHHLKILNLSGRLISKNFILLTPALQEMPIHTLIINGEALEDVDLNNLGQSLIGTPIQKLDLSFYNNFGPIGITGLLLRLGKTQVNELDLRANKLKDDSAMAVANNIYPALGIIDLSFNEITTVGATNCILSLKQSHAHTIKFNCNAITVDGLADLLSACEGSPIRTLELSGNDLNDEGAFIIALQLPKLSFKKLILNSNHITDKGAKALVTAVQGKDVTIGLMWNKITDPSILAMKNINTTDLAEDVLPAPPPTPLLTKACSTLLRAMRWK